MKREDVQNNMDNMWEMLFKNWDATAVTFEGEIEVDGELYKSVTYYPKNQDNPSFVRLNR